MGVETLKIDDFLRSHDKYPVLDVRSPSEYAHAHFPGAISLPLFSDEERKQVGTAYKQVSREQAIKIGLDFFGIKMRPIVETVEQIFARRQGSRIVIVYCWRGGMRSAAIAWLLDLYGFKVLRLAGGYKSFRHWSISQLEKDYPLNILGGRTGSGKTTILRSLASAGNTVIDLEELAKHRGSAFGDIETPQPSQEMFDNLLALSLSAAQNQLANSGQNTIWIEDESQRIGLLNIPTPFWKTMRKSPVYFLEIPFEQRLQAIISEYGIIPKEKMIHAILRIQKRLGGLDTKLAVNFLLENNISDAFRILLKYYDKQYNKALLNRENLEAQLHLLNCEALDNSSLIQLLLDTHSKTLTT